jgi:hypothetical protein
MVLTGGVEKTGVATSVGQNFSNQTPSDSGAS